MRDIFENLTVIKLQVFNLSDPKSNNRYLHGKPKKRINVLFKNKIEIALFSEKFEDLLYV